MTFPQFRAIMAERRPYRNNPRFAEEWQYLTRAARKCLWIARGIPTNEWDNRT